MTAWLLDTNVLSELRKPKPNQEVVRFVSKQPLETLWVSSVTFAEIRACGQSTLRRYARPF